MNLDDQQFIACLRSALHYLYEPEQLRRSPLIALFGLAGRVDASLALQQILLDAIQALKPDEIADDPQQANAWRLYDLLFFRYVSGYERLEVANQLGISDRQLAREQKNAIQALAAHLWKRYPLDASPVDLPTPGEGSPEPAESIPGAQASAAWDKALPAEKPAPWMPVLISVMELLGSLIQENKVTVRCELDDALPQLLVPPVTLRHSLLTLLGWLIPKAHGGELVVTPTLREQALVISVQIPGQAFAGGSLDPEIEASRRLIERVGGALELVAENQPAEIRLMLPARAQVPVLVIDDNADTVQLFQRYVQGSRYSIVGLQDPTDALRLIEQVKPRILLIDVMMPELDGWDLLTQLRLRFPQRPIAVLMCSILPQEGLALSLGADGFLQKPVLPRDFLNALDRLMDQFSPEPDIS